MTDTTHRTTGFDLVIPRTGSGGGTHRQAAEGGARRASAQGRAIAGRPAVLRTDGPAQKTGAGLMGDFIPHERGLHVDHEPAPVRLRSVSRCGDLSRVPDLVVAVPVCNERGRIIACVEALAASLSRHRHAAVVLMVNNSSDTSAAAGFQALAGHGMTATVVDCLLAPAHATAGRARRLAMGVAARWAGPDAVLMTTDADGRVAEDWAEANLDLLAAGANLACGRFVPDPAEAALLPARMAASNWIEAEYTALSIELDARIDPRPHDPWPHHGLASGASLAVRVCDYLAVGGMPPLPCSEDRAFAALFDRHDLRVRHSDAPLVTVSCRLKGRARGGMADAIAARIADPDSLADQRLLPAAMTARRATRRRALRTAWGKGDDLGPMMTRLGLCAAGIARAREAGTFGALWADIEANAPSLAARRMRPSDLARELPELLRRVRRERESVTATMCRSPVTGQGTEMDPGAFHGRGQPGKGAPE